MDGPASADPPALAQRAGGTALAKVEPEELSYSPASSSPQDSSPEFIHWRRHALPGNIESVCPERAGDNGAGLRDSIAVLGAKLASRGRGFPVHPAGPRSWRALDPALRCDEREQCRSRLPDRSKLIRLCLAQRAVASG